MPTKTKMFIGNRAQNKKHYQQLELSFKFSLQLAVYYFLKNDDIGGHLCNYYSKQTGD